MGFHLLMDRNGILYAVSVFILFVFSTNPVYGQEKKDTTVMRQIEITTRFEEQQKALEHMKDADNILSVISLQQIKLFPDVNAAEAVQRISGITLQRDQGEGRFVQLRGTPPQLTNFNINGEQIPSPEGDVRFVGLDVIAADQIEKIEVIKSLTPDMDGDGIAGTVNVVTRSAVSFQPKVSVSIAGGYNALRNSLNQNIAMVSFAQRIGNHGIVFGGNTYTSNQGAHNMEFNYTKRPTQEDNVFQPVYNDIELRNYIVNRNRIGLNASYVYYHSENTKFTVKAMYNKFVDDEQRQRLVYQFGSGTIINPTKTREANLLRDLRDRTKEQTITTINIDGSHVYKKWSLDGGVAISKANESRPDYFEIGFNSPNLSFFIDKTDKQWPEMNFTSARDSGSAADNSKYVFDGITTRTGLINSSNFISKFNVIYNLSPTKSKSESQIKFGAKWRHKTKTRDQDGYSSEVYWSQFAPGNRQIYVQIGPKLSLNTVGTNSGVANLLNKGYNLGFMPDYKKSKDFHQFYFQNFKLNESDTKDEMYSSDYSATEDIYAGYVMYKKKMKKMNLMMGVRYERTEVDYDGYFFKTYKGRFFDTLEPLNSKKTYQQVLPMLHFKYSIDNRSNFRFAYTKTYSRPNFEDILPYKKEQEGGSGDEIQFGNPRLKFAESHNIDLLYEKYFSKRGLFQFGLYYKRIDHFVFHYKRFVHLDSNFSSAGLKEVTMAQNGLFAHVYGAELSFNRKFSFLPGKLKDFGIYSNYTFTASDAYINERVTVEKLDEVFIYGVDGTDFTYQNQNREKITLPGQAKHTLNLGLFYDGPKLFVQLVMNYQDAFLLELGQEPSFDLYYGQNFRLDAVLDYRFANNWNLFFQANNLTNAPLMMYLGNENYLKQQEFYSYWFRTGVRFQIQ
jgi:TonB-dependent receptor